MDMAQLMMITRQAIFQLSKATHRAIKWIILLLSKIQTEAFYWMLTHNKWKIGVLKDNSGTLHQRTISMGRIRYNWKEDLICLKITTRITSNKIRNSIIMIPIRLKFNSETNSQYTNKTSKTTLVHNRRQCTQKWMKPRFRTITNTTTSSNKTCNSNITTSNIWITKIINKVMGCPLTRPNRMRLTRFKRTNSFFKIKCKWIEIYSLINKCLTTNQGSKLRINLIEWPIL